ncbi:hypothetical protein TNCV_275821 [Trichonephila clavipes]|nr:hypothetical protein TNCV_275821 [Trichonephila clavipes]
MDRQLSPFWMSLFARAIECNNDNPHLTFETIVTRVLRWVLNPSICPGPISWNCLDKLLFDGFQSAPGFAQNLASTLQTYHFGQATLRGTHIGSRQCAILGFDQIDWHFTQNQRSQNNVRILCHGWLSGRRSQEICRIVSLRCRRCSWQTRPSRTSVVS